MSSPWRFEPGETLREAFGRVLAEEVRSVRDRLGAPDERPDKAVHEARRSFKRLRALLRLASPAQENGFGSENRRLRDAGRLLAPARDAAVLLASFDSFIERHGEKLDPAEVAGLRQRLERKRGARGADGQRVAADFGRVGKLLDRTERNAARLGWPADSAALQKGFRKSQVRVESAFRAARDSGEAEDLHEWRKRLKDQIAQVELFRAVLPEDLRALRKASKEMAQALGLEHDLCLLSARLEALRVPSELREVRDRLVGTIERDRKRLRQKALRLGETHCLRRADEFARGLTSAWDARQADAA